MTLISVLHLAQLHTAVRLENTLTMHFFHILRTVFCMQSFAKASVVRLPRKCNISAFFNQFLVGFDGKSSKNGQSIFALTSRGGGGGGSVGECFPYIDKKNVQSARD